MASRSRRCITFGSVSGTGPESIVKSDLGQILLALERAQDELLLQIETPVAKAPEMTDAQKKAALDLLRDPKLLDHVLSDLERLGVVGEKRNLLVTYLAALSRKLADPLAVVVQSSAAAGKSSLVQAVLSLVPEEDRIAYSAMTGQSLYYMGSVDLRHKVLCVSEDRGIERAVYALKLLQSEGGLTIASTGKDAGTGRLVSQEYRVEGPVSVLLTTTDADLDEELLSRCLVLTVDESPGQTRRIHAQQRRGQTLEGICGHTGREAIVRRHQDAQRLLRGVRVLNPFVDALGFADLRVRARRDHRKLLGLVEVIAMLHQHQRPVKTIEAGGRTLEVVEAVRSDLELAQSLLAEAMPGLDDLPRQTRALLDLLDGFVAAQARALGVHRDHVRFSRRQVREYGGWGDTQLKVHLRRLVDAELVLRELGPRGGVIYAMACELPDEATACAYEADRGRGSVGPRSGRGRGAVGPRSRPENPAITRTWLDASANDPRICTSRGAAKSATYDVHEDKEAQ
jgi:DNA primase